MSKIDSSLHKIGTTILTLEQGGRLKSDLNSNHTFNDNSNLYKFVSSSSMNRFPSYQKTLQSNC